MTENKSSSKENTLNYRLPTDVTLKHAVKISIVEDKPILMDYWTAINSCYLFVSSFGSFLAVANALHKNTIALLPDSNVFGDDVIHFYKNMPHLKWYENSEKNNLD